MSLSNPFVINKFFPCVQHSFYLNYVENSNKKLSDLYLYF